MYVYMYVAIWVCKSISLTRLNALMVARRFLTIEVSLKSLES